MKNLLLVPVLLSTLFACESKNHSTLNSMTEDFFIPENICADGQSNFTYSLVGSSLPPIENMEPGAINRIQGVRLDFCVSDDLESARLKRVVTPVGQGGLGMLRYGIWQVEDTAVQSGILKLLSEQDYSELKVEGIDVQLGNSTVEGRPYATLKLSGGANRLIYGELFDIDVLSNAPRDNRRLVKAGPIEIKLNYRITGSVGMYVAYYFDSVTILDSNPALPKPLSIQIKNDDLQKLTKVDLTHHGLTDSLVITTDEADYSIGREGLKAHYKKVVTPDLQFDLGCTSLPNCGVEIK